VIMPLFLTGESEEIHRGVHTARILWFGFRSQSI